MKKSKCMKCGRDNISPRHDVMLDQLKYRCNCGHVWFEATFESDIKSGIKSDESWEVPNDIPLDKLRAVSPELWDVFAGKGLTISLDVTAIAADLLRLADENEELRNNIQGCYNCGSQIHVGEKNVCEGCFKALTPASAGKPKT